MTPAERHMQRVRDLGCVICRLLGWGATPASAHHCFDTAHRSDWLTIPLCHEHHQGKTGFHGMGEKAFNRTYRTDETHLIGITNKDLEAARCR